MMVLQINKYIKLNINALPQFVIHNMLVQYAQQQLQLGWYTECFSANTTVNLIKKK